MQRWVKLVLPANAEGPVNQERFAESAVWPHWSQIELSGRRAYIESMTAFSVGLGRIARSVSTGSGK
jgi:hypothetical protein